MADQDDVVRPLWKDVDPDLARRAGAALGSVRTWEVAASPHNQITVTGRRGARRDVLLTTGCVNVESLDRPKALLLLAVLREAVAWTWPAE